MSKLIQAAIERYSAPPMTSTAPWDVASVKVLPNFRLHIRFLDGSEGVRDLYDFIHDESAGVFAALRDPALFAQAYIDCGAVTWPNGLDLAPDAMWEDINKSKIA